MRGAEGWGAGGANKIASRLGRPTDDFRRQAANYRRGDPALKSGGPFGLGRIAVHA